MLKVIRNRERSAPGRRGMPESRGWVHRPGRNLSNVSSRSRTFRVVPKEGTRPEIEKAPINGLITINLKTCNYAKCLTAEYYENLLVPVGDRWPINLLPPAACATSTLNAFPDIGGSQGRPRSILLRPGGIASVNGNEIKNLGVQK